jgi:glycosyltransferase involved in cell wall biosynthesis
MRIFFIIDALIKGGIERRMLELIKTLSKDKKFDIYLISLNERVDYDYVYDLPIKFETIKRKVKKDFCLYVILYKKIKEFRPDIVHSWGSMASLLVAPIAKLLKTKFVNGYIGQAPLNVTLRDPFYVRGLLTFPLSDAIVSNSMAGLKAYRAPSKKSYCIYNGIDFKRFEGLKLISEVKKEILGNDSYKRILIGMLAAFEDRKDYATYINVALRMCKLNDKIYFICIGGGDNLESIKKMVPNDYLDTRIIFLGKRSDVESILQIIDIGVLLTNTKLHGEGVSNAIIEYMASSKPVIATRGGGTDEVIFDDKNGFLVDYAAEDQIIEKIECLLQNETKAKAMGKWGYDFVHEKFDINNASKIYIDLYQKLLSSKFVHQL